MLDLSKDIDSLSNFKRKTQAFLKRMKRSGQPVVLTINGQPALVVQDAASYQRLYQFVDQVDSLEFLRRSLEEVEAGGTRPMRAAVEGLGKKRK